jgi:hypothetical protein
MGGMGGEGGEGVGGDVPKLEDMGAIFDEEMEALEGEGQK